MQGVPQLSQSFSRLNCSMLLSRSVVATLLVTVTALQRPAHRTRSTRRHATPTPNDAADVVVVTHAAGRMGASLCAQVRISASRRVETPSRH